MSETLERLIASWRESPSLHRFEKGASPAEIDAFEEAVGWTLPNEWRELYQFSNGGYLLEGNVSYFPLKGDEFSLERSSDDLRGYEWPVPGELKVAGTNGAGDYFGFWRPTRNGASSPIVEIGQIFEPGCLSIAGSSLWAFLLSRTAFYVQLLDDSSSALDAIGLPSELRGNDLGDDAWREIVRWADPARPDSPDSSYEACLDAAAIREMVG